MMMEIRITGKNLAVTERVKDWITKKASKLERFTPRLLEAHAILKREKYFYVAEMTLFSSHLRIYGEGRHKENLYTAIDHACERVTKQLKKVREKVKDHHLPRRRA